MLIGSLELFDIVVMISLVSSKFTSFCILQRFFLNELARQTKTTPSLIVKPTPKVNCLTLLGCNIIFSLQKIFHVLVFIFSAGHFTSHGINHLIVLCEPYLGLTLNL